MEELARKAAAARAFKQPRPQSWHDVVLAAISKGETIAVAAEKAGVTRAGIRYARLHNPRFEDAYRQAYGRGLTARFHHRGAQFATNGSTTDRHGVTIKSTQ